MTDTAGTSPATDETRHPDERGGRYLRGMARGGTLNLAGALIAQGMTIVILLLLTRALSVREVGEYAQCYAVLSLLNLLSLSGFRAGLTRFIAVHLADGDAAAVRGTTRLGMAVSAGGAIVIALVLVAAAPALATALHDPHLTTGLRLTALTLPASTLTDAALAATRGWRTQRPFTLIGQVYEPVARLAVTAMMVAAGAGVAGAVGAMAVSGWSATLLAGVALIRRLRALEPATPTYRVREIFRFSTVSWVASLASTGLIWADTLLLGFYSNPDVGVYHVATRLVTIAVFVLAPINASFGPYLADLYHRGELAEVRRIYGAATGWVTRLSLPAFVALLVFPADLLRLAGGASYTAGAAVTVALAAGQLVNAVTGPCGTLLNMSGRVGVNMADNAVALVLNIGLNLWLIPAYGIDGAAIAWAVSLSVVNVARVLQVWRQVRAVPVTAGLVKGLAAAVIAFGFGYAVRLLVPAHRSASSVVAGWPWRLGLGLTAIVVAYLGAVLALRLSQEDTMVLRAVVRRSPGRRSPATAVAPLTETVRP